MKILILGYGIEGKSAKNFFEHFANFSEPPKIDVLDNFKKEELLFQNFSSYDLIVRTPSIPPKFIDAPKEKLTSVTKFFFESCPCPIIGVTGTKGKGTTCTMIRNILTNIFCIATQNIDNRKLEHPNVYLLGNIGTPALDLLPSLKPNDVVVYELSSFQLWDMTSSPAISVVLRIEPDHLDVHESFSEYLSAKSNIVKFQSKTDFCIFFKKNKNTLSVVDQTLAKKLPYPSKTHELSAEQTSASLEQILDTIIIPGPHNRENAEAALLACFAYFKKFKHYKKAFPNFLVDFETPLKSTFAKFQPLPHHIEFVREFNKIKYYDDSFSTTSPALEAALNSFPNTPFVLIVGGKDKGFDLTSTKRLIFDNKNLIKAVLIGETAKKLAFNEDPEKFINCNTDFELAVQTARELAEEKLNSSEMNSDTCLVDAKPKIISPIVLFSPCASSFDMFANYKQRGDIFKQLVNNFN